MSLTQRLHPRALHTEPIRSEATHLSSPGVTAIALARVSVALLLSTGLGCQPPRSSVTNPKSTEQSLPTALTEETNEQPTQPKEWALAIHGGAGTISREEGDREPYFKALEEALRSGRQRLAQGEAALDVVEALVTQLEDDPLFNAGRGAVFTNRGTHELDAAIMEGRSLACGAVAGVRNVRNPIQLARQVLEKSPHVLLAGPGADDFSRQVGSSRVQQKYFSTPRRLRQLKAARREERNADRVDRSTVGGFGTVGAVALDRYGNLAAATSTGGLTNKRFGRVGDVPVIGAGTYADNQTAAISCTGKGEEFIRHSVAFDVTARMKYKGETLSAAADALIHGTLEEGLGGLIAVDAQGNIAMPFSTEGMFRGAADSEGKMIVGIWKETRPYSTPAPKAGEN